MDALGFERINQTQRSNWIKLRTLVVLRWVAITGQIAAITVAQRLYNLQLELGLCYFAIGVSVIGNLIAVMIYPDNKRLSASETLLMLLFDILQLAFLLSLTGGLHNPFALLMLVPVTIAATVLPLRQTAILGAVAVGMLTLLMMYYVPLRTEMGFVLTMPTLFVFGSYVALVTGVIFIAIYTQRVTVEMQSMSDALFATQMALSREQKLTDLGGVVAAAAHELGTPLATIKLVSAELMEELETNPDLRDDAALIREQADRCRDILRDMGRAGKDDLHLRHAPFETVVREAGEPHLERGKTVTFVLDPKEGMPRQPSIRRRPEVIHGLRNLIQNAVDFAATQVEVSLSWTATHLQVKIIDDGRGYPPQIIGRLGDPFLRRRRTPAAKSERPGYEGMGLGLFIAKTLLERSGAEIGFSNAFDPMVAYPKSEKRGAVVIVRWERAAIEHDASELGTNEKISA